MTRQSETTPKSKEGRGKSKKVRNLLEGESRRERDKRGAS